MRIHRHTFLALGSVLALSLGACDVAESAALADGPVQGSLDTNTLPGGAIELVFNFQDSEGRQVRNFEIEHEKLMHTIVVSEDLKSFAHVHPELQFNNSFTLRLNEPNEDPDNQMAINAIPRGGKYFVFSEIKPRGAHEVQEHRFDFFVGEEYETEPLVVDQQISNLKYIRYFAQNDSVGTADEAVDSVYKVTLTKERIQGMKMNHEMSGKVMFMLPGKDEMLHFVFELQVRADADSPVAVQPARH